MTHPEKQPELFQELSGGDDYSKPRRRPIFRPLLDKWQFTLNLEHLIIAVIVVIMISVILFALGVEQGKRISNSAVALEPEVKNDAVIVEEAMDEIAAVSREEEVAEEVSHEAQAPVELKNFFTVQVASFRSEETAGKEAQRLAKIGSFKEVNVVSDEKYSAVCVGVFQSRKEAQGELKKLKKIYKDCFVRNRRL